MFAPLVSVLIPSYKRPKPLLELLDRLMQQTYSNFEVVVVEQSQDPQLAQQLEQKRVEFAQREAGAIALHLLLTDRPLGCSGARNYGIANTKGEIVLMLDDDDLPINSEWISTLTENFRDPNCIGVVGRYFSSPLGNDPPPRFPRLMRALAFRYNLFKFPRTYPYGSLRKSPLQVILVTGGALRRSLFDRVGGFDEGLRWGEENTFAFKVAKAKRPEEYIVFDPRTGIWRRTNIKGGLYRRSQANWHLHELKHRMIYQHKVVGHYFPWRFRLFYPLFISSTFPEVVFWIWDPDNSHQAFFERIKATASAAASWVPIYMEVVRGRDCPEITRCPTISHDHVASQPNPSSE